MVKTGTPTKKAWNPGKVRPPRVPGPWDRYGIPKGAPVTGEITETGGFKKRVRKTGGGVPPPGTPPVLGGTPR